MGCNQRVNSCPRQAGRLHFARFGFTIMRMNDLGERFSGALHNASRAWRAAIDRRLRELGLSQAGWMALAMAAKADKPLSQTELADRLGVEAATLVGMIDRLVRAGLIERRPSADDRRVRLIVPTAAGKELFGKVKAQASLVWRELLSDMDPQQLGTAIEVLERLRAKIEPE